MAVVSLSHKQFPEVFGALRVIIINWWGGDVLEAVGKGIKEVSLLGSTLHKHAAAPPPSFFVLCMDGHEQYTQWVVLEQMCSQDIKYTIW